MKSKVYFTKTITPEKVIEMYEMLGKPLTGKVAVRTEIRISCARNFGALLLIRWGLPLWSAIPLTTGRETLRRNTGS